MWEAGVIVLSWNLKSGYVEYLFLKGRLGVEDVFLARWHPLR